MGSLNTWQGHETTFHSVKNWCWHNVLSRKSNSWFAPDHRRWEWGSISFSNGTVYSFHFFKVCWNLTSNKSLYVLCLLYWNGGKIGLLSNKYWLVPPTLPWSNTSWDSFKNWSQHHKRAVKVSISGSLLERHSRTSCPQNWDLLLVNLAFLSPFILAC